MIIYLQHAAWLAIGIYIGWLLRWKRDMYYFNALKDELNKIKILMKIYQDEEKD